VEAKPTPNRISADFSIERISHLLNILLRTLIVYVLLVIAMRIGGKRQIGELQLSELVSALLLSELAAMPIGHEEIPLTFALIPIITVICVEIITAFAVTKSKALRKIFDGKPSVIIERGVLNIKEMERLRLSIEELIVEARLKGVADISELDYAILEDNGELSVFKKSETQSGIAHVIIADGQINTKGLDTVKMSKKALRTRLKSKNVAVCDVFLYTVDDSGKEFLIKKEAK
jgi:uncharacterized membrane protein YcaP (DUF421 family)